MREGLTYILFLCCLAALPSAAQAAVLYLSPTNDTVEVGTPFSLRVYVSSSDQAMNAASGELSYPQEKLTITGQSKDGSIFDLWVQEPVYSNAAGTASFEGVVLNPGYQGTSGLVITYTAIPKLEGPIAIAFTDSEVLANDGEATSIVEAAHSARLTAQPPPPPPEEIPIEEEVEPQPEEEAAEPQEPAKEVPDESESETLKEAQPTTTPQKEEEKERAATPTPPTTTAPTEEAPERGGLFGLPDVRKLVPEPVAEVVVPATLLTSIFIGLLAPLLELLTAPIGIWQSLVNAFALRTLFSRNWLSLLFPWLGLPRRREPWGTVYDSLTKEPLDPAYVTLLSEDGSIAAETLTDIDGRYGFFVPPGRYRLEARKSNYAFPSKRLEGRRHDSVYRHLYFGEPFTVSVESPTVMLDVPMDQHAFDWNQYAKRSRGLMVLYTRYRAHMEALGTFLFYAGFALSALILIAAPTLINGLALGSYVIIAFMRRALGRRAGTGMVVDERTGEPLAFVMLELHLEESGAFVRRLVTDSLGRFYGLVPPGTYRVTVKERVGPESYETLGTLHNVEAPRGIISERITLP